MMIWYTRRITLTCNTAALVPRAVSFSLRYPVQQWKIFVPSCPVVKIKMNCPCRRKRKVPSPPVVEEIIYRPVPSWNIVCTVPSRRAIKSIPSRRDNFHLPSRPVPSWQFLLTDPSRRANFHLPSHPVLKQKGPCTVPSRPVEKIHTYRPVSSHAGNYNFQCFTVPSRPVFNIFPAKHIKTVPSRPVWNITSH